MPSKCCVVLCRGNHDEETKCTVFRIPREDPERSTWIQALPRCNDVNGLPYVYSDNSFICIHHWPGFPESVPHRKVPGGSLRPTVPPFFFPNIPSSCVPSRSMFKRKSSDIEKRQTEFFNSIDKISSYDNLKSSKKLYNLKNVFVKCYESKISLLIFDFDSELPRYLGHVQLSRKPGTLSDITVHAFTHTDMKVSIAHCVLPNNQLSRWTQLDEVINSIKNQLDDKHRHLTTAHSSLKAATSMTEEGETEKLLFLTRQLELHIHKSFCKQDYLFATISFPKISYELLRKHLILPSSRKMRELKSAVSSNSLVRETVNAASDCQKVCALLIDEVKVKPSLIYQGHGIIGYSQDFPDKVARSMLCIMMKCLHGGKSTISSMTPLYSLTSAILMEKVLNVIRMIHSYGGHVIALICDGLRTNLTFFSLFDDYNPNQPWRVTHPLDTSKDLFLLVDPVHILKSIRNNWITEKCKKLRLGDFESSGSWNHIVKLYKSEEFLSVKLTSLTRSSVFPSPIQRQNVAFVLKVFNDKTIAALKSFGGESAHPTVKTIQCILEWWNTVNVKSIGEAKRFNDSSRQAITSENCEAICRLKRLADFFAQGIANNGKRRIESLTIDTHKALCQTTNGLANLAINLLKNFNFSYVLLGELQQDRLEGEFGCWRQMCGGNNLMTVKDIDSSFKIRGLQHLSKLEILCIDNSPKSCKACDHEQPSQETIIVVDKLGTLIEALSEVEICCSVYIAGYLVKSTPELANEGDLVDVSEANYLSHLSRGSLMIPSESITFWVQLCLAFAKTIPPTCHNQLSEIVHDVSFFYDIQPSPPRSASRRLANVLLSGIHKRAADLLSANADSSSNKIRRISDRH